MDCNIARARLDAYVDQELEPTPVLELDQHFESCGDCRCELDVRRLLKRAVAATPAPVAPRALRLRVGRALDAAGHDGNPIVGSRRWTTVLSVAAVLALFVGSWLRGGQLMPQVSDQKAYIAPDIGDLPLGMLGDIVERHVDQLPADITPDRPEQVTSWSRDKVRFRVRTVEWGEPSVRLLGARVSHIGDNQAIKLYYGMGDSRLTTVVFQVTPSVHQMLSDANVAQREGVHRERIGSRVLSYQNVRGYTVPLIEHDGVVYAFTGDLDQRQLLHLVASAKLP
jgi:anti-sigma factor RsiW